MAEHTALEPSAFQGSKVGQNIFVTEVAFETVLAILIGIRTLCVCGSLRPGPAAENHFWSQERLFKAGKIEAISTSVTKMVGVQLLLHVVALRRMD